MFCDDKLTKFFIDQGLDRHTFREEQLFDREVDLVYSINQKSLKKIFTQIAALNTANLQNSTGDTITLEDCQTLIRDRMNLDLSKKII